MKSNFSAMVIASSMLMIGASTQAAEQTPFHNGMSLQGFTGILNTPSAHVTKEGDLYALYTNQKDIAGVLGDAACYFSIISTGHSRARIK